MKKRSPKKTIFVIVCIAALACAGVLAYQYSVWKNCTPVAAYVQEIERDTTDNSGNARIIPIYNVCYSYEAAGRQYQARQPILSVAGFEIGEERTIRIDPDDPGKMFSTYQVHGVLALFLFLAVFDLLLLIILRRERRERRDRWKHRERRER